MLTCNILSTCQGGSHAGSVSSCQAPWYATCSHGGGHVCLLSHSPCTSESLTAAAQVIEFESTALMIGQLGLRVNLIAYPVVSVKKVEHHSAPVSAQDTRCCVQEHQASPLLVGLSKLQTWTKIKFAILHLAAALMMFFFMFIESWSCASMRLLGNKQHHAHAYFWVLLQVKPFITAKPLRMH